VSGADIDGDRSGDLRPAAVAILDRIAASDDVVTVGDLRAEGLLPANVAGALFAFAPPATIRVWRRGIDGSTASCSGRVDEIPFEQYVKGVLPHEWITSWEPESLKTGAVAIRTYATWWVNSGGKYDCADLDDTTASQVYKDEFLPKTDSAVDATAGMYIMKDGEIVFAEYSAENSDPTKFGVDEPHCTGRAQFGHGRGTCQWGTQRWAKNDGRTFDWIAAHYYPGSEVINLAPVYDAEYVADDYPREMVSGEEAVVYLELDNLGNSTWSLTDTLVGTASPRDRDSAFYVADNWESPIRPTAADHSNYTPGTTGRFTFVIRAPEVTESTDFIESFALVTSDGQWFGPEEVTWTITVHPNDDGGEDTGEPRDSRADHDGNLTGGCAAGGTAGSLWFVVVVLFAVRRRLAFVALAALLVSGCAERSADTVSSERTFEIGGSSTLEPIFVEAQAIYQVPAALLATVSYVETRLRFVYGYGDAPVHDGHPHLSAVGLMALADSGSRDLNRAAGLAGVSEQDAQTDPRANVLAAAALLADYAGTTPTSIEGWRPALEQYGGVALADDVYGRLARGWRGQDVAGEWMIVSGRRLVEQHGSIGTLSQEAGYGGAIWNPAHSSNYSNASRGAAQITHIVIHTAQGSYGGTISWFKNSSSNVSSQYVVRSSDGEVTQMVDDSDVAWHDACFNSQSIGIEHEGFVNDPDLWYTDALYMESAKLTRWLADAYGVPLTREFILGHGETDDCSSHTDPGSGWDWEHYMNLVQTGGEALLGAGFAGQDNPDRMVSGERAVVWIEMQNESNITWGLDATRVGTQMPMDRESEFFVDGNWLSTSRATGADHSDYSPGSTGRFTFEIEAPQVTQPTTYVEHFQLVQEGVGWFGPVVSMTIEVVPAGWDGDTLDDGGTNSGDPRTDNATGGTPGLTGGCAAVGSSSGQSTRGWLMLLIGVAISFRSRRPRGGSRRRVR